MLQILGIQQIAFVEVLNHCIMMKVGVFIHSDVIIHTAALAHNAIEFSLLLSSLTS